MGIKQSIKKYYEKFSLRKKISIINEQSEYLEKKILELMEENDSRKLEICNLLDENNDNKLQINRLLNESNDLKCWSMQMFHEYYGLIDSNKKSIASLLRLLILKYYEGKMLDNEKKEVIDWLTRNSVRMYPYDFCNEYLPDDIEIYWDKEGWRYVLYSGKPVYFPKTYSDEHIKAYFSFLIMEQDKRSPHCYFTNQLNLNKDTVFIDAGAAEGLIGLSVVQQVKCLYLIECDSLWIEPLQRTFRPYSNVQIIDKMVGNSNTDSMITLNSIITGKEQVVIKADVEGAEHDLLKGLDNVYLKSGSSLILCAYHNQSDEETIGSIFAKQGIPYEVSKGFVIPLLGEYEEPYLRKALVRCTIENDLKFKYI